MRGLRPQKRCRNPRPPSTPPWAQSPRRPSKRELMEGPSAQRSCSQRPPLRSPERLPQTRTHDACILLPRLVPHQREHRRPKETAWHLGACRARLELLRLHVVQRLVLPNLRHTTATRTSSFLEQFSTCSGSLRVASRAASAWAPEQRQSVERAAAKWRALLRNLPTKKSLCNIPNTCGPEFT